jgi:hypothetical protein
MSLKSVSSSVGLKVVWSAHIQNRFSACAVSRTPSSDRGTRIGRGLTQTQADLVIGDRAALGSTGARESDARRSAHVSSDTIMLCARGMTADQVPGIQPSLPSNAQRTALSADWSRLWLAKVAPAG